MAKKGQTKKNKQEDAVDSLRIESIEQNNVDTNINTTPQVINNRDTQIPVQNTNARLIEYASNSELLDIERACAMVCKRYETMARLDGGSNSMFKKFSAYYTEILAELEKRVESACKVH